MTDERQPEGTPSTDPPNPPTEPVPTWEAPASAAAPPPPPLAPYVSPTQPAAPAAPAVPAPAAPAGPQPAVAWGAPAPVVAAPGGRSTLAAVAGVAMLVLGVLGALFGLLFFAVAGMVGGLGQGGFFDEIPGMPPGMENAIGGFIAVIGVVIIVYSLLYVAGGIGVLRSRGWGRVIGIVVGIISGLIWLAAVFSPSTSTVDTRGSILFAAVLLAIHAYIVVVLIAFWRSRAST